MVTHPCNHPSIQEAEVLGCLLQVLGLLYKELEIQAYIDLHKNKITLSGMKSWHRLSYQINSGLRWDSSQGA